jgi:hypothetical protein
LGEEKLTGRTIERGSRVQGVEQDRLAIQLDRDRRDPVSPEPRFDLGRREFRIAALIELILQRAVGFAAAEQTDPDRDRGRLDLDAGPLEDAVGGMG